MVVLGASKFTNGQLSTVWEVENEMQLLNELQASALKVPLTKTTSHILS